uniref:Caspase family protein n=1 Tax=Desertifilum tharense IPPAS B-1220 TaxID=1781255 RepID=A0ACD5GXA4_9CYAN
MLIHRFGFNPKDIHTLTDSQATRQNLLDAFEEYLIKPVKAGDVAVYHFSGHGSRVFDPDPIPHLTRSDGTGLNGTLVPVDGHLPNGYPSTGGTVKDIMGHTLFLLMSAVPTENFTAVLDSCYSGGATRRDFRVRSRQGGRQLEVSPEEKAYQEKWLSKLQLSREEYVRRYREGVAKGVVFAYQQTQPNRRRCALQWVRSRSLYLSAHSISLGTNRHARKRHCSYCPPNSPAVLPNSDL